MTLFNSGIIALITGHFVGNIGKVAAGEGVFAAGDKLQLVLKALIHPVTAVGALIESEAVTLRTPVTTSPALILTTPIVSVIESTRQAPPGRRARLSLFDPEVSIPGSAAKN